MNAILAIMYREYKVRITSLVWLFYDLVMPLIYLLLFGIGLDKAFSEGVRTFGEGLSYNAFFLPGVVAMSCFGIAINTAYGFFVDRDNGIFYEFLTYPMSRSQFLLGKVTFNCLTSVLQSLLTIGLGAWLLGVQIQWSYVPVALLIVILGTMGWFLFLMIFALRIRRNDSFNTFLNVFYFVVLFVSSLFYPLDRMPAWFVISSYVNPITWHTDALRYTLIGIGTGEIILLEMALYVLFLLFSFRFAVRTLQNLE